MIQKALDNKPFAIMGPFYFGPGESEHGLGAGC